LITQPTLTVSAPRTARWRRRCQRIAHLNVLATIAEMPMVVLPI
jgi:hypothetical protein